MDDENIDNLHDGTEGCKGEETLQQLHFIIKRDHLTVQKERWTPYAQAVFEDTIEVCKHKEVGPYLEALLVN